MAVLAVLAVAVGALENVPIPVLPLLQRELSLTAAQAALLTTTLVLSGSVTGPITAKLADLFGGRRMLLVMTWIIVAGAGVSAFADSLPVMLVGQTLQGIGVGILPVAFTLVREYVQERMSLAVGLVTGPFIAGTGLGIVAAGPIADAMSRRWVFLLPTLVVAALAVAAQFALPRRSAPGLRRQGRETLDWPGALLLALALGALTFNLSRIPRTGWLSTESLTLFAVTLVSGACWVAVERRAATPLIDLRLLGRRGVWSSVVVAGVVGAGSAVPAYLFPQLLAMPSEAAGFGFTASTSQVSLYLFPAYLCAMFVGPLSGQLVRWFGSRLVVAGALVVTAAGLLFAALWHSAPWHVVLSLIVAVGIGVGAAGTALYVGTIASVDPSDTGVATSVNMVARGIGAAIGVQISAAVLSTGTNPLTQLPTENSFRFGFLLAAILALLPLAIVAFMPGRAPAPSRPTAGRVPDPVPGS
ncbi:MFS transporter [Streptomyces sp. NPDC046853]|uniref:MFS transporter n=1 Tax=unclassified Streptomyces TaxID=2593676 RepID=UPI0033CE4F5B